jgi:hypothetical protein
MMPLLRIRFILAAILVVIGIGFACLPDTWIETWFGFDPDGGNGWIEVLLSAAPLAIGVGLGLEAFFHGDRGALPILLSGLRRRLRNFQKSKGAYWRQDRNYRAR